MPNFAEQIEAAAGDEPILAVAIGPRGYDYSGYEKVEPLSWADARPILDYEYYTGFGSPDCHAILLWTETKIITVTEYDGATGLVSFPRSPTPCTPTYDGAPT